jgi:hypothetical protein
MVALVVATAVFLVRERRRFCGGVELFRYPFSLIVCIILVFFVVCVEVCFV